MDYLSVKEIAELWGVSIRMVNYYLNTGRIQGAIRKSGGWLIPANTPHPADLRKSGQRGQEKIPPRMAKCYMPLISRPCDNGFQNLLLGGTGLIGLVNVINNAELAAVISANRHAHQFLGLGIQRSWLIHVPHEAHKGIHIRFIGGGDIAHTVHEII